MEKPEGDEGISKFPQSHHAPCFFKPSFPPSAQTLFFSQLTILRISHSQSKRPLLHRIHTSLNPYPPFVTTFPPTSSSPNFTLPLFPPFPIPATASNLSPPQPIQWLKYNEVYGSRRTNQLSLVIYYQGKTRRRTVLDMVHSLYHLFVVRGSGLMVRDMFCTYWGLSFYFLFFIFLLSCMRGWMSGVWVLCWVVKGEAKGKLGWASEESGTVPDQTLDSRKRGDREEKRYHCHYWQTSQTHHVCGWL